MAATSKAIIIPMLLLATLGSLLLLLLLAPKTMIYAASPAGDSIIGVGGSSIRRPIVFHMRDLQVAPCLKTECIYTPVHDPRVDPCPKHCSCWLNNRCTLRGNCGDYGCTETDDCPGECECDQLANDGLEFSEEIGGKCGERIDNLEPGIEWDYSTNGELAVMS